MNKLIALLLITLPLVSNAKVLAWIENKGGGKIVLTDTFCESELKSRSLPIPHQLKCQK